MFFISGQSSHFRLNASDEWMIARTGAVGMHRWCFLVSATCFLYSFLVNFKGFEATPTNERDIKHFGNSRLLFLLNTCMTKCIFSLVSTFAKAKRGKKKHSNETNSLSAFICRENPWTGSAFASCLIVCLFSAKRMMNIHSSVIVLSKIKAQCSDKC